MNEYDEIMRLNQENYRIDMQINSYIDIILGNYEKRSIEYKLWKSKISEFLTFLENYNGVEYPKEVEQALGLDRQNTFCSISSDLYTLIKRKRENKSIIDSIKSKESVKVKHV